MTANYLSINRGQADGQTGNVLVAVGADNPTGRTSLASFLSAYDAVGAAIIAISGDAYSATTHQFTNSGSTGLTSAQLHTQLTALNAAVTSFLTGYAFVTGFPNGADFVLYILRTHLPTIKDVDLAMESFRNYLSSRGVAGGQQGVDMPPGV